jgi:hypothetical protein
MMGDNRSLAGALVALALVLPAAAAGQLPQGAKGPGVPKGPERDTSLVLAPEEAIAAVVHAQVRVYLFDAGNPPGVYVLGPASGDRDRPLKRVPLSAIDKDRSLTPAVQVRPVRMAIIAASFPFRKQVERFRHKLRLRDDTAVLTARSAEKGEGGTEQPAFRFLGVNVERRELDGNGKPAGKFQKVDVTANYKVWMVLTGRESEPEDPALKPIIFPGLVMPRLKRAAGSYPEVEMQLKELRATLEDLRRHAGGKTVIPRHCPLRVIDTTVQPGLSYQYRLQVRMANPLYGRKDVTAPEEARAREVVSAWYEVPQAVVMPPELVYYAVDQKELDREQRKKYTGLHANATFNARTQVVLQAHRWLPSVSPSEGARVDVGEWVVAERLPVYRGEYAGQRERVEVPYWRTTRAAWMIADDGTNKKGPGVQVPFGHEGSDPSQPEAILVDFRSGNAGYDRKVGRVGTRPVRDTSAGEVLILEPNGKLILREGARDTLDRERQARLEMVRKRIDEIRKKDRSPFGKD